MRDCDFASCRAEREARVTVRVAADKQRSWAVCGRHAQGLARLYGGYGTTVDVVAL